MEDFIQKCMRRDGKKEWTGCYSIRLHWTGFGIRVFLLLSALGQSARRERNPPFSSPRGNPTTVK